MQVRDQLHTQATYHFKRSEMGTRTGLYAVAKRRIYAPAGKQIPFVQNFNQGILVSVNTTN